MEQTITCTKENVTPEGLLAEIKASYADKPIHPEQIALPLIKEIASLFMWGDTYYSDALKVVRAMVVHYADPRHRATLPKGARKEGVETLAVLHRFLSIIASNVPAFEYYAATHVAEHSQEFPGDYERVCDGYLR